MQRAAEKSYLARDWPALCKIADRLINDSLKNRKGNIRLFCSVVHQRLDVRLGKDAAARSDRIDLPALGRQLVKPRCIRRKKRRHVIDEGTCPSRTDAVHALLWRIAEVCHLGILAAEFDDRIRFRNQRLHRRGARDNLLHERKSDVLRDAHARRTSQRKGKLFAADDLLQTCQILTEGSTDLGKMARIIFVHDFLLMIEDDELDRRRADVYPHIKYRIHELTAWNL